MAPQRDLRIEALKRFALAITILNIAGHLFLGFEQPWLHPLVALPIAYSLEIFFEWLTCRVDHTKPRFSGGFKPLVLFLLPAHISGLAVSMLLFANERLLPIVFATAVAILSKHLLRVKINNRYRHFLNPSNTGIAITLLLFPWVGIAPPYQFTESVYGVVDWLLPMVFIVVGSFLNIKLTGRMPLIAAWFFGFAFQACMRSMLFHELLPAMLAPMTGVSFLLFSFYMISDPATTPEKKSHQALFGFGVALLYGALVSLHIVFGQFFALMLVCAIRGGYLIVRTTPQQSTHPLTPREIPALHASNSTSVYAN